MRAPDAPRCNASPPIAKPRHWIGDRYGYRTSGDLHSGIDIGAQEGTPVLAVLPGIVRAVYENGEMNLYGNTVILEHPGAVTTPDPIFTLSAHMQYAPAFERGAHVEAGQMIGAVGRTAGERGDPSGTFRTDAAHLHFEFLDRWPPQGPDRNRLEPTPVFQIFGVDTSGDRIAVRPGSPAACAASEVERRNDQPSRSTSRATGGGGSSAIAIALLAWAWSRSRR